MADFLQTGLWGLMRAPNANLMTGHLGAAMLAGELLKRERSDLQSGVGAAIDGELRRIMAGEESWFSPASVGFGVPELFLPVDPAPVASDAEARIVEALTGTLDAFHESGHNVIFATLAMRAIRHMPEAATEPVVEGIAELTRRFAGTRGGRGYYGKEEGWRIGPADPLPPPTAFPAYRTLADMVDEVLAEAYASRRLNRRGYGGVVHVVNHVAALLDLARLGYPELALQALPAQREHFTRWRLLPDVSEEFGASTEAPCDPRTRPFWDEDLRRDTARLTHRVKGMYGLLTLLDTLAPGERRQRGEEFLRFLAWN
jgi:hypothetical protein